MKPKRYTTREQILADIDKAFRKANRLKDACDRLIGAIDSMDRELDSVKIKQLNEELDWLVGKRERILNTRLKRLQYTLAAFDTPTICPEIAGDVCLQRI